MDGYGIIHLDEQKRFNNPRVVHHFVPLSLRALCD